MTAPIDLGALLRGTRRLWALASAFVLLGGVVGYLWSSATPKVYQATTTLLVGDALRSAKVGIDDVKASQSVAQTYGDIVLRQPVLEGTISKLHLPTTWLRLRERVRVDLPANNPQLIVVTVEAGSPAEAGATAREIGNQLLALSPKQGTTQMQKFVLAQLAALQQKIQVGQSRVAALEGDLSKAASQDAALLRWRIDNLDRMVSAWQDNYASLSALMPSGGTAASLEVLESPYGSPSPVRPRPFVNAMLGAVIAGMLAVAFAYAAELHPGLVRPVAGWRPRLRRRRAERELPSPGPDETPRPVEVAVPDRVS
jgi:capsular polysaccharide biosynthesis protein